jgi:hypothetical protein
VKSNLNAAATAGINIARMTLHAWRNIPETICEMLSSVLEGKYAINVIVGQHDIAQM